MTDEEIADLLRSNHSIVVIEAPAGCGKTYQAANYAADMAGALSSGRLLVLTHTHAACSVIAERTKKVRNQVDIRTLDGLIHRIAQAYRLSLDLPEDVGAWARQNGNGYERLAEKVAVLMCCNPMIGARLGRLYPIIICDEHQDSNAAQDKIVQLIGQQGSLLRVFGDPMQIIPGGRGHVDLANAALDRWDNLKSQAVFGELETPHRWRTTNPELGAWILQARNALKNEQAIDMKNGLPRGVRLMLAENGSLTPGRYQLAPPNWGDLNGAIDEDKQMLLVAKLNDTIKSLRGTFRGRFPIWEGHTRGALEKFIAKLGRTENAVDAQVSAFVECLQELLVGFTNSNYGDRFKREVATPTARPTGDRPPHLKQMAELIRGGQDSRGFSRAAEHLKRLVLEGATGFEDIRIDLPRELGDLIRLKDYHNPSIGFAEISQRRSRAYPKPPRKALSTIHKSKGLEAERVVLFACDGTHFPGNRVDRNLLYVALSRATESVTIMVSRNNPSPLVDF